MIPHGVEVYVALDPIDLRWGFDRLAGVVTERLGRGARSGASRERLFDQEPGETHAS